MFHVNRICNYGLSELIHETIRDIIILNCCITSRHYEVIYYETCLTWMSLIEAVIELIVTSET